VHPLVGDLARRADEGGMAGGGLAGQLEDGQAALPVLLAPRRDGRELAGAPLDRDRAAGRVEFLLAGLGVRQRAVRVVAG
jgi:hypothetical protein